MSSTLHRMTAPNDRFPEPGDLFQDRYRIVSVINRGGFGRVYHAQQTELGRDVAIKVLQPVRRDGVGADEEARRLGIVRKRFEREAQLVSQLRDSHTVVMYDYGTTDRGLLYMVLEYVDGQPLNEVIEALGPMEPARVVKIARQVLSSLEEAHALNMLHRDVKPQNIMLFDHAGRTDQVKVLDFGLAKSVEGGEFSPENPDLTGEEVILGTPRYMSPEQIRGESMGPPTDVYALGLVMFEMLTGYKAVEGESTMNTLARHLNELPIALPADVKIPGALRQLVDSMLSKDASRRPQTAQDVLAHLEHWHMAKLELPSARGDVFVTAGHDVDYSLFEAEKRKKALAIVAGIMGLFLALAVLASLTGAPDGEQVAEAATTPEDSTTTTDAQDADPPSTAMVEIGAREESPPASPPAHGAETEPSSPTDPAVATDAANADEPPSTEAAPTEPAPEPEEEEVEEVADGAADVAPEAAPKEDTEPSKPKRVQKKKKRASTKKSPQRKTQENGLRLRIVK